VHAAVPGDVGTIGMIVALLQRKRLFVRHCGTFGEPVTVSDRLLLWILERIAGGPNVVMATGGAELPPSRRNPNISWIFATTLSRCEIDEAPQSPMWQQGEALRLVTVGRLTASKNIAGLIGALPAIRAARPGSLLDIVGEGELRPALEAQARALGLAGAITFHGNVSHSEVLRILSRAHLFVFPTRVKEGFPKAVLEALACGLPVVATCVSVIPQLLRDGSGRLLKETTPEAVAQAVLDVTADAGQLKRMKAQARQAAQGYTLEAWGELIRRRLDCAWGPLA
jgi:glycosyltransferase involved in cell wall biosynthesis